MSLRLAGARQAGLEEEGCSPRWRGTTSARLDERQRAALALADAFVTDPTRIGGALRDADVLQHLTPAEIVEVLFDVIAWSKQKVLVALRIDAAVDADTFTPLGFDAAGKPGSAGSRLRVRARLEAVSPDDRMNPVATSRRLAASSAGRTRCRRSGGRGRAGRPRPCSRSGAARRASGSPVRRALPPRSRRSPGTAR